MAKCRACGTENQLDDTHRAGTQLMKNLPKDMSEIESKGKGGAQEEKKTEEGKDGKPIKEGEASDGEEDKKEKKKKKKKDGAEAGEEEGAEKKKKKKDAEEEEEEPAQEEGMKLDSDEIGKSN